uniref:Uncharacterized protein n=1 Tax=Nothobranchius pienaari TaxID=704102 RepID=A0A1A8LFP4_9TELE
MFDISMIFTVSFYPSEPGNMRLSALRRNFHFYLHPDVFRVARFHSVVSDCKHEKNCMAPCSTASKLQLSDRVCVCFYISVSSEGFSMFLFCVCAVCS